MTGDPCLLLHKEFTWKYVCTWWHTQSCTNHMMGQETRATVSVLPVINNEHLKNWNTWWSCDVKHNKLFYIITSNNHDNHGNHGNTIFTNMPFNQWSLQALIMTIWSRINNGAITSDEDNIRFSLNFSHIRNLNTKNSIVLRIEVKNRMPATRRSSSWYWRMNTMMQK